MKEVETITESIWPDNDDQPWLLRLFWAEIEGRLACVGMEVRSARLPQRQRRGMPAEPSERLSRMASEQEAALGRVLGTLPRDGGCLTLLSSERGMIEDIPPAELTADRLRRLGFGAAVAHTSHFREAWARLSASLDKHARTALLEAARRWRRSRKPIGRPTLSPEFLDGVARAYKAATGSKITAVRRWAMELDPDRYGGKEGLGVADSTVNRWIAAARSPEMGLLPPSGRKSKEETQS